MGVTRDAFGGRARTLLRALTCGTRRAMRLAMNTRNTTTGTMAAELECAAREAEGVLRFPWLSEADEDETAPRDTIAEAAAQGRADALAGEPAFAFRTDEGDPAYMVGPSTMRVWYAWTHAGTRVFDECAAYADAYTDALAALAEVPAVLRA